MRLCFSRGAVASATWGLDTKQVARAELKFYFARQPLRSTAAHQSIPAAAAGAASLHAVGSIAAAIGKDGHGDIG